MAQGTVKWFNGTYGFIVVDGTDQEIFVHQTAIQMKGFRTLEQDQKVEFEIGEGPKGAQAEQVTPIA
jgi:CspA family cold shock protein